MMNTLNFEEITYASIMLMNPLGKVLLQLRDNNPLIPFPRHWAPLGGRVEDGEDPNDAINRELLEEVELVLEPKLWSIYASLRKEQSLIAVQYLYTGNIDRSISTLNLHEGQALDYFGLDEISKIPIAFEFAPVIKEILYYRNKRERTQ